MSYRCTDPFLYGEKIFAGGALVPDDHPILQTHAEHFTKVEESHVGTETASSGPNEVRTPTSAAAEQEDLAAWLAAESKYEDEVQDWLAAEEQYQTDVAAWLAAEAAASTTPAPDAERKSRARTARH